MRTSAFLLLMIFSFIVSDQIEVIGQCKIFTKKRCFELLEGYTNNGQYNSTEMFEGEEATLIQTFYSKQDYRLAVCSQSVINEDLYFEVLDYHDNVLYSTQDKEEDVWDFNVESTQQLKIHVVVPDDRSQSEYKQNGCVSILVGFRNDQTASSLLYPYSNNN